ncbi:hypothetical protein RB653_008335 [Dictyostelium firmibasis]|uniref:Uncharacterized protein n=1 Tax=Dictyostelium firmibasis TaxID=79012 RepID=A0AAN7YWI8_9MYCE
MQIFIKESTNKQEWFIIDLQGHLEYSGELKNETLGTLAKKPNTKDDFTFQIGSTLLAGKRVPLKKPLLVMKKIKLNNNDKMTDDYENDKKENEKDSEVEYSIEGICNDKIQFTTRPTTFIPQSSVVYGSPTHKSPSSSPKTNSPAKISPTSSPIKNPQFNN